MALKLDISEDRKKEQIAVQEERNRNFKIAWAVIGMLILGIVGYTVFSCVSTNKKIASANEEYAAAQQEYVNVLSKKSAMDSEGALADPDNPATEPGQVTQEIQMHSAKKSGDRVAEIQTEYAMRGDGYLTSELKTELQVLSNDTTMWYGDKLNPETSPIVWKFLTEYDTTNLSYNVAWGCYTEDESYLLMLVTGVYESATDSFKIKSKYTTIFGDMYIRFGSIESDQYYTDENGNVYAETVDDLADELSNSDLFDNSESEQAEDTDVEKKSDAESEADSDTKVKLDMDLDGDNAEKESEKSSEANAGDTDDNMSVNDNGTNSYADGKYYLDKTVNTIHLGGCPAVANISSKTEISESSLKSLNSSYHSCPICDALGEYEQYGELYVLDTSYNIIHYHDCKEISDHPSRVYTVIPTSQMSDSYIQQKGYISCLKCHTPGIEAKKVTETPKNSNTANTTAQSDSSGDTWIYWLNSNTGKFHYESCSYIGNHDGANWTKFTGTREDVISNGWSPCEKCNP